VQCDWLGITLQWCIADPEDLDLYLFVPLEKNGVFKLKQENAIYWATQVRTQDRKERPKSMCKVKFSTAQIKGMRKYKGPYVQNGGVGRGGATIMLERDDVGVPAGDLT